MKIKRLIAVLLTLIHTIGFYNQANSTIYSPNTEELPPVSSKTELFENHIESLYSEVGLEGIVNESAFRFALIGYYNLLNTGSLKNDSIITIIDYEKPSNEKRLYVINLHTKTLDFYSLVAHGMNSGNVNATQFSNRSGSKQSSIGFFITGYTYSGKHDFSLKLIGLDDKYNSNALQRGIVFHAANYVSEEYIARNGRLGRSFGCPALPVKINKEVINTIKGGSCLFIYFPDKDYLNYTSYLDLSKAASFCYHDRDFTIFEKAKPISPNLYGEVNIK